MRCSIKSGVRAGWLLAATLCLACEAPTAPAADRMLLHAVGDQDYPPITYLDDRVPRGFDVDVLKALADELGRDLQLELLPWDQAQTQIQEGRADVLTGMSVTEERKKAWDFATPTLTHTFNLFITGKDVTIHGVADLQGRRVGIKTGALPELYLKTNSGAQLVAIASYKEGFDLLKQGGLDAVAADQWVGGYILNKYRIDGVVLAGAPFATLESGIAVRKGNAALLTVINTGLEKLRQRGTIEVIRRQWEPKQVVYLLKEEVTSIVMWTAGGCSLLLFGGMAAWIIMLRRQARARRKVEAELRESEARLRALFDQAAVGMAVVDLDGGYIRVNQKLADIVGYTPQEMLGMSFKEITHPDDLPANFEMRKRRLRGFVDSYSLEKRYVRKDGSTTWVNVTVPATRGGESEPQQMLVVVEDIAERKRAEQALVESERRYRTLIDTMAEGVVLRRTADSALLLWNPAAERVRGGTVAHAIDEDVLRLRGVVREDGSPIPYAEHPFEIARRTGLPKYNVVMGRKLPDGRLTWSLNNSQPLFEPGAATPYAVMLTTVDITETRRFEAALERMVRNTAQTTGAEFMRTLVAEMAHALGVKYCFISELAPGDPGRARTLAFCVDGEIAENFEYELAGTPCAGIANAAPCHYPLGLRQLFPDGRALVDLNAESYLGTAVYASDGSVLGLMSVMDDKPMEQGTMGRALLGIFAARAGSELERMRLDAQIRELNLDLEERVRLRTAQLELANRELETFSYSVSHDLRAPLRSILGFGNFMLQDNFEQLDAEGKARLQRILAASERMGKLIDDLLKLARISRHPITPNTVRLHALAAEVAAALAEAHPHRRVEVVIAPDLAVNGDTGLLRVVLENLLGNAWKFTGKRADARIELGVASVDGKRAYYVRDNGAGFDMSYAGKLFAPFQRMHTQQQFEGTGVGLATVKRIIELHQGRVWIESAVGHGTTVYFTVGDPA